ncbi:hypothetical protein [Thalassomonas actiniarum]|uniref:Uncharacterized protein n=1 Tax=Thalassomonas actiniarum TaxID=485447 RepID=A0AAE9YYF5_9GAMM|nr:hypothetical protein [Thalassomonas actiniarum]WDE02664.1 hypothetical protein SG35_030130 [Thalassomonas actiniarum]
MRNAIAGITGADHPHLDLLSELTPAITLLRSSFTPESINYQPSSDDR